MKTPLLLLVLAGGSAGALAPSAGPPTAGQLTFFENKIRPVLAEHCYRCHSISEGKSKGGLTLDTRDGWQKGGETGPAISPGQPDDSLLIKAVRYHDNETAMPPKDGKLADQTITDLEEWVRMGAPDPRVAAPAAAKAGGPMTESMKAKAAQHWAYQPVKTPAVPAVKNSAWPANPIDHFILAQLEQNGLTPSPPADQRTLIRRAYLDLTGLPPTPDEVLAFVKDESLQAFEKVVDDLLARPQYGERWGRHWLDVARFADTRGSAKKAQTTLNPNAWTYRDYVISAFNQDKPFDQFIREQIAADLLPDRSGNSSLAALGFLTQGDQFMGNRQDIINDQIDVVSKGFLGLTVTCARCHDHKFDPVPQADYYSLHGIFDSCREPAEKPAVVAAVMDTRSTDYQVKRAKMEQAGREKLAAAMNRAASTFNQSARAFMGLAGIDRKSPAFFTYLKSQHLDGRIVQEVGRLFQQSMGGRAGEGHPVMQPLRRLMAMRPDNFSRAFPAWQAALLKDTAGIHSNSAIRAVFTGAQPKSKDEALDLYASVFLKADAAWKADSAAWAKSGGQGFFPGLKDSALEEVRTAVADPGRFISGPLDSQLKALPREIEIMANGINAALATLEVSHAGSPGLANVLKDERNPHNSPVLLRGQLQNPGPVVPRQFLEVLSGPDRQPFTQGSGRLELAAAIASPSNPLTARVLVNRLWLHHFGEGFISTPDDLGVMSGAPSHPELLDYLASTFMKNGWSLKQLHRTILLSKTWQQSSGADPEKAKIDSFNRLLWRQNLHRLDFEALRDSLLFMGGQLDLTMGGHPVNIESEPYSQRRSVYGYLDRNEMAEFMRHFDVANACLPTGRRFQTIVPQQALFRMNSLLVIEQARNIIQRADFQACDSDTGRMKKLYEIIYQRWPKPKEMELAAAFLRSQSTLGQEPDSGTTATDAAQSAAFTRDERRAAALEEFRKRKFAEKGLMDPKRQSAAVKEAVRDPGAEKVDRTPLTPWEKYAQALLMTSEMAYVN
jgi:cytochrome c553